jgi:hypothetical protein
LIRHALALLVILLLPAPRATASEGDSTNSSLQLSWPQLNATLLGIPPAFIPPVTWVAAVDPCSSWEGVVCNQYGEVTEVSLSEKGLKGRLPVGWSELSALEILCVLLAFAPTYWKCLSLSFSADEEAAAVPFCTPQEVPPVLYICSRLPRSRVGAALTDITHMLA